MYKTVYKEIEVDVDLSDFDDDDLIEELDYRGINFDIPGDSKGLLAAIWEKRRLGKDYQTELDQLIWYGIGKIV